MKPEKSKAVMNKIRKMLKAKNPSEKAEAKRKFGQKVDGAISERKGISER